MKLPPCPPADCSRFRTALAALRQILLAASLALPIACGAMANLPLTGFLLAEESLPDFSAELPRIPPRDPQDAIAAFRVAAGFRIELLASEPLVVDPVAIAFDADGRLFVVEMRGYSEDADQNLGRIRVLHDVDGDGRYDTSQIFADGLSWPTAITCYGDGVFVAAAPDLIYFRDQNQDGRADEREVVFQGFGRGNVQGLVNTLTWGLDNRIHGATSSAGATLIAGGQPEGSPISLRGRDFCFDPRSKSLGPTSGGGQHGMSFDRWGDKFVCANSDHLQQVMYEDRYLERSPRTEPLSSRLSIAADGPQADVFRTSPVEPWRIVRTRLRVAGAVSGPIEGGGRAAGYFTGATGVLRYRGNALDPRYLDYAFVCDVGSNLIHRKKLIDEGVSYRGQRVDEQTEFVSSSDIWFRPVQLANAPDGSIYVLDMYREVIEHPASLPPEIKRHLDLTSGRNRGRIYRIVPDDFVHPGSVRLGTSGSQELVRLLEHPNGWHRETAARLIYERQDRAIVADLVKLSRESRLPEGRLHALYALAGLEALVPEDLVSAMADSHAHVRRHAVRLAEGLAPSEPTIAEAIFRLAEDPSADVRYQVAFSMSYIADADRKLPALTQLAKQSTGSPYAQFAVRIGTGNAASDLLTALLDDTTMSHTDDTLVLLQGLAAQVRRDARTENADVAAKIAMRVARADAAPRMSAILPELLGPAESEWCRAVLSHDSSSQLKRHIARLANTVRDVTLPLDTRIRAATLLAYLPWDESEPMYRELLRASQTASIQQAAFRSLQAQAHEAVPTLLWELWTEFSPALRREALDTLMSRGIWQESLLAALSDNMLAPSELSASQQQQLARSLDPDRWAAVLQSIRPEQNRSDRWQKYFEQLQQTPDTVAGLAVFRRACATCHQLEGEGHAIGPNLAAMQNRGAETILTNVLEPNREVNPQYLAYTLTTADGRVLSGMIRNETATSIELVAADNKVTTVLRADIDTLTSTGQSLMPTGLEQQITPLEMKDLVGYLLSVRP
jgi:putative membrane-bound dehydrogenase-like protein